MACTNYSQHHLLVEGTFLPGEAGPLSSDWKKTKYFGEEQKYYVLYDAFDFCFDSVKLELILGVLIRGMTVRTRIKYCTLDYKK